MCVANDGNRMEWNKAKEAQLKHQTSKHIVINIFFLFRLVIGVDDVASAALF